MKLIYKISLLLITLQCVPAEQKPFNQKAAIRLVYWYMIDNKQLCMQEIPVVVKRLIDQKANIHQPVELLISGDPDRITYRTPLQLATQRSMSSQLSTRLFGGIFKDEMLKHERAL